MEKRGDIKSGVTPPLTPSQSQIVKAARQVGKTATRPQLENDLAKRAADRAAQTLKR